MRTVRVDCDTKNTKHNKTNRFSGPILQCLEKQATYSQFFPNMMFLEIERESPEAPGPQKVTSQFVHHQIPCQLSSLFLSDPLSLSLCLSPSCSYLHVNTSTREDNNRVGSTTKLNCFESKRKPPLVYLH